LIARSHRFGDVLARQQNIAETTAIDKNADIGAAQDFQGIVMSEFSHARIVHQRPPSHPWIVVPANPGDIEKWTS